MILRLKKYVKNCRRFPQLLPLRKSHFRLFRIPCQTVPRRSDTYTNRFSHRKSQFPRHIPQLLYLKWWSLRKTKHQTVAAAISKKLIETYPFNPCIAPVLLAEATDALSNQKYKHCRKLLTQLIKSFPQTDSAAQAKKSCRD